MSYINQFNETINDSVIISSLTPNRLVASDSNNYLISANTGVNFTFNSNILNLANLNGFSTSDLIEGSNLYFTTSRARQAISSSSPINYNNTSGVISLDYNTTNLQITASQLNTIQDINITASPTFNGLTLNTGFRLNVTPTNGYILRCDGLGNGSWQDTGAFAVTSVKGTLNQIAANSNYTTPQTGAITLSLPQDISTSSNLTFNRIRLADGVVGTPSYSFTNSTNSGLYLSSTNQVSLASNGVESLRSDSSGNITIPGNLTVNGTTTTVNSSVVEIKDNVITLSTGNTTDTVDSGVATQYNTSNYGVIYRIAGTSNYTIRTGVTSIGSTISTGSTANFIANNLTGTIITTTQNTITTLQGLTSLYSSGMRFTTSPVMGYVLQCANSSGDFQWSSLASFGVSSITASVPLLASSSIGAVTLSLDYNTTNLQLSSSKLNTIQDIATTSSPTFGGLTVNGTAYATSAVRAGDTYITSERIEINTYGANDRYAYIDFLTNDTEVDYSMRLIRNPGVNGDCALAQRGTGTMYLVTENAANMELQTSGTTRMIITAGGNIGINQGSPGQWLEVNGNIAAGHRWNGGATTTPVKIGTPGNDGTMTAGSAYLQFQDSATDGVNKGTSLAVYTHEFGVGTGERVRFAGNGNVGIGLTSPSTKLEVTGSGAVTPSLSVNSGTFTINNGGDLMLQFGQVNDGSAGLFMQGKRSANDGTAWGIYLNPLGGYVGIGNTNPSYLLDVKSTSNSVIAGIRAQNTATFGAANLYLDNNHPSAGDISTNMVQFSRNGTVKACIGVASQATVNDSLIFNMSGTSSSNAKMCLTPTGILGIGTDNPNTYTKLDVNGTIASEVQLGFAWLGDVSTARWYSSLGSFSLTFYSDTAGGTSLGDQTQFGVTWKGKVAFEPTGIKVAGDILQLWPVAGGTCRNQVYYDANYQMGHFYDMSGRLLNIDNKDNDGVTTRPSIQFRTGPSLDTRMTIRADGNVGIGTTSPGNILQVGSGGRLRISNGTTDYSLLGSIDVDSNTNTRIVVSGNTRAGYAGNIDYVATSTGYHVFYTTDSGTERMRIANNGNVGIATASPNAKLEVSSSSSTQLRLSLNASTTECYDIGTDSSNQYLRFYGNKAISQGYTFTGAAGKAMEINPSLVVNFTQPTIYESGVITNSFSSVNQSSYTTKSSQNANFPFFVGNYRELCYCVAGVDVYNSLPPLFQNNTGNASVIFGGLMGFWSIANGVGSYYQYNINYGGSLTVPVGMYMVEYDVETANDNGQYDVYIFANGTSQTLRSGLDFRSSRNQILSFRDYFTIWSPTTTNYIRWVCSGTSGSAYYCRLGRFRITRMA